MDINEALLPKPSHSSIFFMFLKATLFKLTLLLIDSAIVWLAWTFVLVPKFGLVNLGMFQVAVIVIGLNSLYRAIKGA